MAGVESFAYYCVSADYSVYFRDLLEIEFKYLVVGVNRGGLGLCIVIDTSCCVSWMS